MLKSVMFAVIGFAVVSNLSNTAKADSLSDANILCSVLVNDGYVKTCEVRQDSQSVKITKDFTEESIRSVYGWCLDNPATLATRAVSEELKHIVFYLCSARLFPSAISG